MTPQDAIDPTARALTLFDHYAELSRAELSLALAELQTRRSGLLAFLQPQASQLVEVDVQIAAVEQQLLKRVPPAYAVDSHHWLILHGRYVCQARKPLCGQCAVAAFCDFKPKTP